MPSVAIFPPEPSSWSCSGAELQELCTLDEIKNLLASTINAYFTSPPILRDIYMALNYFGLARRGGERVL
jgi:hypothetical protein